MPNQAICMVRDQHEDSPAAWPGNATVSRTLSVEQMNTGRCR